MHTIEQYWRNCELYGFIREEMPGKVCYRLPAHMGQGGFEVLGDTKTAMAVITDITLYKPWAVFECAHEKYLQFSQFYSGEANFYQKRSEIFQIEHGLNYFVNYPHLSSYKKVEANQRLVDVGLFYREGFFQSLLFELPDDFWETAARVLNPGLIPLPVIATICDQIKNCRLTGNKLNMFVYGKAHEALAITLDYIYAHKKPPPVYLSKQDRAALEQVKTILQRDITNPPRIEALSAALGMNQQKLMTGFKHLNGMTIYTYLKNIRMEHAAELLQENSMSISEISRYVGYHGDGHFQKAFKDIYSITLSGFRKELQEK